MQLLLQISQKPSAVFSVHLGVVKLEGQFQCGFQPVCFIFSPNQKRIIEAAGIEIDSSLDGKLGQGRGADDHIVLAGFIGMPSGSHPAGETAVTPIKGGQILMIWNVTGGDGAGVCFDNGVDGQAVKLHEAIAHRQKGKLFHSRSGFADAPTKNRVKGCTVFFALFDQPGDIQGLK